MEIVLLILASFACADVFACGLLLATAWVVYSKYTAHGARERGEPVPPFPVGQCLWIFGFLLLGLAVVYGSVWLLLRSVT